MESRLRWISPVAASGRISTYLLVTLWCRQNVGRWAKISSGPLVLAIPRFVHRKDNNSQYCPVNYNPIDENLKILIWYLSMLSRSCFRPIWGARQQLKVSGPNTLYCIEDADDFRFPSLLEQLQLPAKRQLLLMPNRSRILLVSFKDRPFGRFSNIWIDKPCTDRHASSETEATQCENLPVKPWLVAPICLYRGPFFSWSELIGRNAWMTSVRSFVCPGVFRRSICGLCVERRNTVCLSVIFSFDPTACVILSSSPILRYVQPIISNFPYPVPSLYHVLLNAGL